MQYALCDTITHNRWWPVGAENVNAEPYVPIQIPEGKVSIYNHY